MKKVATFTLISSVAFLSACSTSTPTCSDTETVDLVKEITMDELRSAWGNAANSLDVSVEAIRTTDRNETVDSYTCAAQLEMTGPGGTETADISYTVQSTDKGDEFYVEVYGL